MTKSIVRFFQTTLVGGVFFLFPVVLLVVILGKALSLVEHLAVSASAHLPFEQVIGMPTSLVLAVVAMVAFCFLAGLFARTAIAAKMVLGLEDTLLNRVPGYALLKNLSQNMLGLGETSEFKPVFVRLDDSWQIGFETERTENGLVCVFIPDVPNPYSGSLQLMTSDRIKPVGLTVAATMTSLKGAGVGLGAHTLGFGANPSPVSSPPAAPDAGRPE